MTLLSRTSAVAVGERALLIMGESGAGKSSLALALIDRGAKLIGDDGVWLDRHGERIVASPPPNTAGLLEVRNLGLMALPTEMDKRVALAIRLDPRAERYIEAAEQIELEGLQVPLIRLWPDSPVLALKVELALERYGLA